MKVILFGATGMVGQGVLRECLLDSTVDSVLVVGRSALGQRHEKLTEIIRSDVGDLESVASDLDGYQACFFCLGVSSVGMNEPDYTRITYDLTMRVARTVFARNPELAFVYVSGASTDSTEHGRSMWARVKGRTENALLAMSPNSYMFRPGYIQPLHGITSKTRLYRALYAIAMPLYPILRRVAPRFVLTTEEIGRAMIAVATHGAPTHVLEVTDIRAASGT
jgi:uncharacterized protein YbjT (DUF2867 family)